VHWCGRGCGLPSATQMFHRRQRAAGKRLAILQPQASIKSRSLTSRMTALPLKGRRIARPRRCGEHGHAVLLPLGTRCAVQARVSPHYPRGSVAVMNAQDADQASRHAALTLALALPGDTLLYLLLPLHAAVFGITLPEAGVLLAANRIVRIFGYRWVANFYATRGPRAVCLAAAVAAALATFGYATLSGLWPLLLARLLWGLAFAAMNIANQALPTAHMPEAPRRMGRARSIVAIGPMAGLLAGRILADLYGPRAVFLALAGVALVAPFLCRATALDARAHCGAGCEVGRARRFQYLVVLYGFRCRRTFRLWPFTSRRRRARQERHHRCQPRHGPALRLGDFAFAIGRRASAAIRRAPRARQPIACSRNSPLLAGSIRAVVMVRRPCHRDPACTSATLARTGYCAGISGSRPGACPHTPGGVARHWGCRWTAGRWLRLPPAGCPP
jgi:MFS family permease